MERSSLTRSDYADHDYAFLVNSLVTSDAGEGNVVAGHTDTDNKNKNKNKNKNNKNDSNDIHDGCSKNDADYMILLANLKEDRNSYVLTLHVQDGESIVVKYEKSEMSPLQYAGSNLAKQFTRDQTNMTTDSQKRASGALGNRWVQEPVSNVLEAENSRSQERRSRMVEKNDNVNPADLNFDQTDKYMSNNKTDSHEIASGALGNRWVQEPVSNVLGAENSRSQERRSHMVEKNDNVDPADLNFDQTDKYMSNNKTDSHEIASDALGDHWVQEPVSNVLRAENSRSQERRSRMVEKNDNVDPADLNFDQTDKYMSNNKTDSHEIASGAFGNRWVQEPVSNVSRAENSRSQERWSCMVEENDNVDPADLNFDQTDKYMSNNKTDSHEIASGDTLKPRNWEDMFCAENILNQKKQSPTTKTNDEVDHADPDLDRTDKDMYNKKTDNQETASDDIEKPKNWEDKFCAENILNQKKQSPTAKTNDEVDHADLDLDRTDKDMYNKKTNSQETASDDIEKPRNWEDWSCAKNILNRKRKSLAVENNDETRTNEDKSQKLKMKHHIGEGIDRQLKTETDFGVILTEKGQKKILNKDQQNSLHLKIRKKDEDLPKKKEVKDHESSRLTFREKLMDVLKRPYDDKECDLLWEHVCIRKPKERHRESRSGRTQPIVLGTPGRSHLDNYKRLAMEVEKVKDDRLKLLYILRGYFFWLQFSPMDGSFAPWSDKECLKMIRS